MGDYKDLRVWQAAMGLAATVYRETKSLPDDERYGLTSQIRRAVVSISANIAEGQTKGQSLKSHKEFARFVSIAQGSAAEVESLLILSGRLEFLDGDTLHRLRADIEDVRRMLSALRTSIENMQSAQP